MFGKLTEKPDKGNKSFGGKDWMEVTALSMRWNKLMVA
jgi:hypothetical protein